MSPTTAILQTAGGAGGIAVVLLAGPRVGEILEAVWRANRPSRDLAEPGRLQLGQVRDAQGRLDEALLTVRPGRRGEQVAEINIHGGPRVTQRLLKRLEQLGAVIGADDPAVTAGLDCWPLAAEGIDNPAIGAELLAALPAAKTSQAVSMLTEQWSAGLSALAARAAAACESADVEALPALAGPLRDAADRLGVMRRLLAPPEVVLAGPPNAGKSQLANTLLERRACIVTDTPGTTRDWIRELADVGGWALWLTDTAGLWAAPDPLDVEAVRRAWEWIDSAELVLAVYDAADPPDEADPHWRRLNDRPHVLPVANKCDLPGAPPAELAVSASRRLGLGQLRRAVLARLGLTDVDLTAPAAFTERQGRLLFVAADALAAGDPKGARSALQELLSGAPGIKS